MKLKNHLAVYRKAYGLSTRELGRLMRCSDRTIRNIEQGQTTVSYPMVWQLAALFGISMEELFFPAEQNPPIRLQSIAENLTKRLTAQHLTIG